MTPRFKRNKAIFILSILIIIPIVLILLPADYFDTGQSMCLSVLIFGQECPGCGLTRACQYLIHFDFEQAAYHNPLSFLAFPALAYFWVKWFLENLRIIKSDTSQ